MGQPVFDWATMPTSEPTEPKAKDRASLHDLTFGALETALESSGVRKVHAAALWRSMYRGNSDPEAMRATFTPPLQRWLDQVLGPDGNFSLTAPAEQLLTRSSDGLTQKFLLRLEDGETVETVLMRYTGRNTACVSTQAGCAMGCVFCATGQMGFTRHLRASEIVLQVRHAQRAADQGELRNLVLMGMGEPLHNYDSVMTALEIISDTRGLNIGPRRITISTVGLVPGIRRMADEGRPYHLAVSLHGANDADRARLVPAGRRWSLAELMAACRHYVDKTQRKIFFEWTLIAGQNDSQEQAAELAALLTGIHSHVNLIPLNPTAGFTGEATAAQAAYAFQAVLGNSGIPSTIRQRRGIDVAAGCGQLKAEAVKTAVLQAP
jgi:23S rRNA (adenine2503-C2)-methyltransferase